MSHPSASQIKDSPSKPFDGRPALVSLVLHLAVLLLLVCWRLSLSEAYTVSLVAESSAQAQLATFELSQNSLIEETESQVPLQTVPVSDPAEDLLGVVAGSISDSLPDNLNRPATFFGSQAYGKRFVFVLDISVSMRARSNKRFYRARDELVRAVSQLEPGQEFFVVLFSHRTTPMFFEPVPRFLPARPGEIGRLKYWLEDIRLQSGTDPRRALSIASRLGPDAIFFLTDGGFNQPPTSYPDTGWLDRNGQRDLCDTRSGVSKYCSHVPIHCIAYENRTTFKVLAEIGDKTGGSAKFVPAP